MAKRGTAKFLRDVVNEIWYNNLKDADLFYTKVMAIGIMALLDTNSRGLHVVNMIPLRTNMIQLCSRIPSLVWDLFVGWRI